MFGGNVRSRDGVVLDLTPARVALMRRTLPARSRGCQAFSTLNYPTKFRTQCRAKPPTTPKPLSFADKRIPPGKHSDYSNSTHPHRTGRNQSGANTRRQTERRQHTYTNTVSAAHTTANRSPADINQVVQNQFLIPFSQFHESALRRTRLARTRNSHSTAAWQRVRGVRARALIAFAARVYSSPDRHPYPLLEMWCRMRVLAAYHAPSQQIVPVCQAYIHNISNARVP